MRIWVLANLTAAAVMAVLIGREYGLWGLLLGVAMWLLGFGMMFEICFRAHGELELEREEELSDRYTWGGTQDE